LDVEFADLRKHPPGSHPGIVLFRPVSLGPLSVNRFVERFVRATDLSGLSGCIAVVDPQGIRRGGAAPRIPPCPALRPEPCRLRR
jgi:hypothetical protein